jgi:hypothetical protein
MQKDVLTSYRMVLKMWGFLGQSAAFVAMKLVTNFKLCVGITNAYSA